MLKNHFDPASVKIAAKVIHAINHRERIWILNLLHHSMALRPMEIAEELKLSANTVNIHLKLLVGVGLLKRTAENRKVVTYSLKTDRASQLRTGVRIISIKRAKEYVRFGTIA